MDKTQTDFLKTQDLQPFIWLRYIDDSLFIWTHGEAELTRFMVKLNQFLPNLKFTYESSQKKVAFLDLNVSLENGCITTDLYTKSTDCHQYLHCSSAHPDHLKNSIIYSQALRLSNICTYERDFQRHALDMKSWFLERGYSKKMIDSQMAKVKFGQKKSRDLKSITGVPFVITYHPKLREIASIMKKYQNILYQDETVKRVFTPFPMVSYRNARKLSSYLVRAKLYPLERKRGSYKCGSSRCQVCNNIEETETFSSTVTGETYKINHHLCCNDKCLIYLLTCKVCAKQYTGKTVDKFRSRWNNYKDSDRAFLRGEEIKQKFLHEHFLKDDHHGFEKDVSICLIDKTQSSDPHKREYYWMRILKTLAPFGLNTEDTY